MSCQVEGSPNAPILIVGMAPGKEELDRDSPFVGGSGWLLWSTARHAGFTRADCYIVNVIGEWPSKKSGDPSAEQILRYRPIFEQAVSLSKARICIPMGGTALRALTGLDEGIESWRGYLVRPDECLPIKVTIERLDVYKTSNKARGIVKGSPKLVRERVFRAPLVPSTCEWIVPCLHPAGVLRTGKKTMPAFMADLRRAVRALHGELIPTMKFLEQREGTLPIWHGPMLIDVETVPYLRVGMAGRTAEGEARAWTAPLSAHVKNAVLREYAVPGRVFCAHNAQFDLARMAEMGMPWDGPVYDTMLAAAMLQPDLYKGLNEVASLYLDRQRWKHKADLDPAGYNLDDAKTEYELYEITRAGLAEEGMLDLFEGTIMPALRVLSAMTRRGIKVHPKRRDKWLAELTVQNEQLLKKWQGLVGEINPRSSPQVRKVLYGKYGLRIRYNKSGSESAERAAIQDMLYELEPEQTQEREVLATLLDIRVNGKLLSSYAKRPVGDDGRIHPYYLPVSKDSDAEYPGKGIAGTGRIQARDPNIQQLPKEGIARTIIIPSRPDRVIATLDFKQLELRIAAHLSNDFGLLADLEGDVFAKIMARLGCDRTRAKNVAYGTIYGGGPRALVKALKTRGVHLRERDAKELQQAFAASYPDLWRWRQVVINEVAAQYRLRDAFGRIRYFYLGSGDGPAAVDFKCQGTAAGIVWDCLVPLDEAATANDSALLATVHDEFVVEVPRARDARGRAVEALRAVMERPYPNIGPDFWCPVEVKIGESWGEVGADGVVAGAC